VLLPEAEKMLPNDRLSELGAQMARRRLELLAPKAGKLAVDHARGFSGSTTALVVGLASALSAVKMFSKKTA
jgi:hypothetical protein